MRLALVLSMISFVFCIIAAACIACSIAVSTHTYSKVFVCVDDRGRVVQRAYTTRSSPDPNHCPAGTSVAISPAEPGQR